MPTTKKSVQVLAEELRTLGATPDDAPASQADTWLTPAFWTMAAAAVTNLVTVATLLGWVNTAEGETLTKALTGLLGATQVIIVNSVLVWKYIAGRNQIQTAKITARYHYMEAVATEKLRAEYSR
jgi:hypothetical protein